jgi:hypothetical protein
VKLPEKIAAKISDGMVWRTPRAGRHWDGKINRILP